MSEHTELENHIELGWWGVFDWDEHIATFKLKDDARRWMAWNNATHDRLCIRKVRSLFVEDARIAAEEICR